MARYRMQLLPNAHTLIAFGDRLTPETLSGVVEGVVVNSIEHHALGYPASIDVELARPTQAEALDDLFEATQRLGYTMIDGEISEVVDATVQSVGFGAVTGLGLGAAVKSPVLALVLGVVGGLAGDLVSSELMNHELVYSFRGVYPSGWEITAVPAASEPPLAQLGRRLAVA
jgi:hypothetical protein